MNAETPTVVMVTKVLTLGDASPDPSPRWFACVLTRRYAPTTIIPSTTTVATSFLLVDKGRFFLADGRGS